MTIKVGADHRRVVLGHGISHSLIKALKRVPGFDLLDEADLVEIAGASVNLVWREGSCIFEKGFPGEALYIVLSGAVRIYDVVDGRDVEIARTGAGDFFGEHSLLLETTHTKNVQAVEDTELLVLSKQSFARLLASNPKLEQHIHRTLEARRSEAAEKYQTTAPS
ncbi:MAG TPA: cyclic nucleotide-binding domain-containing protein [Actinomycetota bacterium]|nr:cyclic nucleotide-binding domain-containing protein [Actinomycetota bacterium]